jgi:hypothetical protein
LTQWGDWIAYCGARMRGWTNAPFWREFNHAEIECEMAILKDLDKLQIFVKNHF